MDRGRPDKVTDAKFGISVRFIKTWDIEVDNHKVHTVWLPSALYPWMSLYYPPWFEHHMRGLNRTVILNGHPTLDYWV